MTRQAPWPGIAEIAKVGAFSRSRQVLVNLRESDPCTISRARYNWVVDSAESMSAATALATP